MSVHKDLRHLIRSSRGNIVESDYSLDPEYSVGHFQFPGAPAAKMPSVRAGVSYDYGIHPMQAPGIRTKIPLGIKRGKKKEEKKEEKEKEEPTSMPLLDKWGVARDKATKNRNLINDNISDWTTPNTPTSRNNNSRAQNRGNTGGNTGVNISNYSTDSPWE